MALIYCPECHKKVSEKAHACPQCGYPIQEMLAARQEGKGHTVLLVVVGDEKEQQELAELFGLTAEEMAEKRTAVLNFNHPVPLVSDLSEEEARALVERSPVPEYLKLLSDAASVVATEGGSFGVPDDFFIQIVEVVIGVLAAALLLSVG